MSPATKSKTKDKLAARAVKDQMKASLKATPALASSGNGVPGSAYNPLSGTFHTLEAAAPASVPPSQSNGRFRNIDDTDNHSGSSLGTSADFDALSNNGSCSGESEDHKEKTVTANARTESIPGCDTDKRDKIRQKNERKHQRQKEKRAQELLERCNGYLMSRKLEVLSQQFVAMGFSSERATMALILNEGRVEESVAWLFEGEEKGEEGATTLDGANLKIDIADELAQVAALEKKYKCTMQDVERAVVTCEGDLVRAEEALKAQKQEPTLVPPRQKQSGESVVPANGLSNNRLSSAVQNPVQCSAGRTAVKGLTAMSVVQQGRDERDFSYAKPEPTASQIEVTNRSLQPPKKMPVKQERARVQVTAPLDKRRIVTSSSTHASQLIVPASQVTVPLANPEVRYVMGHEGKVGLQAKTVLKEPITMMQRPQSILSKQNIPSNNSFSVSPPQSTGWHPNVTPNVEALTIAAANGGLGHNLRNSNLSSLASKQFYAQNHYQPFSSGPMEPAFGSASQQFYPQNHYQSFASSAMEPGIPEWTGTRSTTTALPTRTHKPSSIALPSSLGLFSGQSSSSTSAVDWSTGGLMPQFDYTNIDWSLDSAPLTPPLLHRNPMYISQPSHFTNSAFNGGVHSGGLPDGKHVSDPANPVGPLEWTSAFNGRDLLRAPRQSVTSPSP